MSNMNIKYMIVKEQPGGGSSGGDRETPVNNLIHGLSQKLDSNEWAALRFALATRYRFKNGIVWRPVALDPSEPLPEALGITNGLAHTVEPKSRRDRAYGERAKQLLLDLPVGGLRERPHCKRREVWQRI